MYEEIIKAMKDSGYRYFGVRNGKAKKVGQYCAISHDWQPGIGIRTSKLLSGTSATVISDIDDPEAIEEAIKLNTENSYNSDSEMTYIVGGDNAEYGDDADEILINTNTFSRRRGARVIAIL